MSETKIFCSVIVFTLGVYTIILLQYELFKLNKLNGGTNHSGSNQHHHQPCNTTIPKTKFNVDRLNCGSAGEILSVVIQNCTELPCDISPDVNYTVVLSFSPSRNTRNISTLEIQTFVQKKRDLKYLHKETLNAQAKEGTNTTLKFSFTFPAQHLVVTRNKKVPKCSVPQNVYMVGVEIWDVPSGIGEVCMMVPMNVNVNS